MKKILMFLIVVCLNVSFFTIPVKAGIRCSDGWESSCSVPGPGCCSHHGGVKENNNYSSNSNYSYSNSSNSSSSDPIANLFLFLMFIGFIYNQYWYNKK